MTLTEKIEKFVLEYSVKENLDFQIFLVGPTIKPCIFKHEDGNEDISYIKSFLYQLRVSNRNNSDSFVGVFDYYASVDQNSEEIKYYNATLGEMVLFFFKEFELYEQTLEECGSEIDDYDVDMHQLKLISYMFRLVFDAEAIDSLANIIYSAE